ncbi:MAG: thermonuclease family protein [Magnetococcales bacterium]|nr:thermonuclease family protein [Magnetococcales bacterium]MBF0322355.1 thermonuclease family protein [Magnetococcales bacterium]
MKNPPAPVPVAPGGRTPFRTLGHVLVVVVVVVLVALPPRQANTARTGEVVPVTGAATVLDGDSLRIDGQEIRLHGVDAWEAQQTCPDQKGQPFPCGAMASAFLQELVKDEPVLCIPLLRDRYRRLVSHCLLRGRDLGWILVEKGWAVAYTRYSDYYRSSEQQARDQRLGGWRGGASHEPRSPETWRIANRSRSNHR